MTDMLEIEAVGEIRFVHIKDKYQSDAAKQRGIDPNYQLQLSFPKNGDVHKELVASAKQLGVRANGDNLRYKDGDLITLKDGTQPQHGKWLINLSSKWKPSIVDQNANDLELKEEPGDGTLANVAFKIGSTKEGKLTYFLTGVQLLKIEANTTPSPHKFGAYTQLSLSDDGVAEEEPEF